MGGDDVEGEVEPFGWGVVFGVAGAVEDDGVGGDDDFGGFGEDGVGVGEEGDLPGPVFLGGELLHDGFEAGGVGDGGVEEEVGGWGLEVGEGLADQLEGGGGFGDAFVVAVHGGEVAEAVVAAEEEEGVAEGGFDGGEEVVAVDEEGNFFGGLNGELVLLAEVEGKVGAGGAHDGEALAFGELVAVTDDFEGGGESVAVGEEPGEVVGGGLEGGVVGGREE